MPLDLESDLDLMLNTDDFAVTVTVGANNITGIFDADYVSVNVSTGMESVAPAVVVKTSDVEARGIVEGTALTIGGVNYVVKDRQADEIAGGATILTLHKV